MSFGSVKMVHLTQNSKATHTIKHPNVAWGDIDSVSEFSNTGRIFPSETCKLIVILMSKSSVCQILKCKKMSEKTLIKVSLSTLHKIVTFK